MLLADFVIRFTCGCAPKHLILSSLHLSWMSELVCWFDYNDAREICLPLLLELCLLGLLQSSPPSWSHDVPVLVLHDSMNPTAWHLGQWRLAMLQLCKLCMDYTDVGLQSHHQLCYSVAFDANRSVRVFFTVLCFFLRSCNVTLGMKKALYNWYLFTI